MIKNDDWKGEDKIRIKTTQKQKHGEISRLVNLIYHRSRREESKPAAGAKKHRSIVLSALSGPDKN